jgi:pimeloyl-ACP methyl ester carboxylesterase
MVVWGLALLHPGRVRRLANLALPYQERGEQPWLEAMEAFLGPDYYFVHFNRQPGVADAVLDANPRRFLRNLFRTNVPPAPPSAGNAMVELAQAAQPLGDPILSAAELEVFASAFEHTGFAPGIHWYRNLDRNWHTLGAVDPVVRQPALMIHGDRDVIPRFDRLADYVPDVEVVGLDAGHWIQQERPAETNRVLLDWLRRQDARRAG